MNSKEITLVGIDGSRKAANWNGGYESEDEMSLVIDKGSTYASVDCGGMSATIMMKKLWAEHPDEVTITHVNRDGSCLARVPKSWVTIRPPRKNGMTDEQKADFAERMKNLRNK
jgi:hypothetical protein